MSTVHVVTDATFESEVLGQEGPVLVDFWAEWCPPCRMMSPIVEEVAKELDSALKVTSLDTDANPLTAHRYSIVSIPTFIVFRGGEAVATIVGGRPKKKFLAEIKKALG